MHISTFLPFVVGTLCATNSVMALYPEGGRSAQAVDEWIESNINNLPSDYDTFAQHSQTYRRAIYQKLDAETKGNLWTKQLDSYVSNHRDLFPKKLDLIKQVKDFVASSEMSEERMHELENSIKDNFGSNEAWALFAQLGNDASCDTGNEGGHALSRRQGQHTRCECKAYSPWSCGGAAGCLKTPPCIEPPEEDGCGFLYKEKCDGLC